MVAQGWTGEDVIYIHLLGESASVEGAPEGSEAVQIDGGAVLITAPGNYQIDGVLTEGEVVVESPEDGLVRLILDGVDITHSDGAPLSVMEADDTEIFLFDGTTSVLRDGASYAFPDPEEDEPNAALFSKDDLVITGNGDLQVYAQYNDGITSKDDLVLMGSGHIQVEAADDGVRGKDSLEINNGTLTVESGGDGLKSDEDEDLEKGFIIISGGNVYVTAGGDGVQADNEVLVEGGLIHVTAGGGASANLGADDSAKGLKATNAVRVGGGRLLIDAADDGVHADYNVEISGGAFQIATGDDGVHADELLRISGGDITVTESYEGLESAEIQIEGGRIHVTSSDDGINVAGGVDGSGGFPGRPGGQVGDYHLGIHGGEVTVYAQGDGLDANGTIEMTGGTVLVHGPTGNMNGPLDYDGSFTMTGGFLVAAGSSGMAQAPSAAVSTQYGVLVNLSSSQSAGTLFHLQTAAGEPVLTFAPSKAWQSVAFSAPALANGETYEVYSGGASTGTVEAGLYSGGVYTPGTLEDAFTISGMITTVGQSGGGRRP